MKQFRNIWKLQKRMVAFVLAVVMGIGGALPSIPVYGSNVWPQKSTAPFYCIDGGKSWKATDQYELYKFDSLPSPLTEEQARRLFWAYPSNWNALKEAVAIYDPELYEEISDTVSGPNIVKKVKDDGTTKFAWIADHKEIETRAIAALEQMAAETSIKGKDAPGEIKDAVSKGQAVSIFVPSFQDGPAGLLTEFRLGSEFVQDIASIEMQSIWDNGSSGGVVGWIDAIQENNQAKSILGETLYEITWGGDSIQIRNNGSSAMETAVGDRMSGEEKSNKTRVLYKITMRENSGWHTAAKWNEDYLSEWMDFKSCINDPGHQRLYKADIRIAPSEAAFYFVVGQEEPDPDSRAPEYGEETIDVSSQIYKHEETFESTYPIKLKKLDHETGKPLKGSQFYLYERFDSEEMVGDDETDGGLNIECLSFVPWNGFQVFSEGTTNSSGEILYTDHRRYNYAKTYCDGHPIPDYTEEPESDANQNAEEQWMKLVEECEERYEQNKGKHFHWISGEDGGEDAFVQSGCKADRDLTYENFIQLRFTYTWKEIQARHGYILHGLHKDDEPIEMISITAAEAGTNAEVKSGNGQEIQEIIWYAGNTKPEVVLYASASNARMFKASESNAWTSEASASNASRANAEMICWTVRDHRTEGEIHINKRDMDLFRGENDAYCSYGDNEGDGILEGSLYGLFAAEDIVHPDTELAGNGVLTNTGVVYKKNDLVSVAEADKEGNACFSAYTAAPGMEYNYKTMQIEKRKDLLWNGPENLYDENWKQYGNWWIKRPLILGTYYIKELSRSEGYELSVNGKTQEWTNYGTDFNTPEAIAGTRGTTVVSFPELAASMEGEEGGSGYNEFPFEVTSVGTCSGEENGYELIINGFPEGTQFYRVDYGEQEVTGPRAVGTEKEIVKNEDGNPIWERAKTDRSNLRYEPLYDSDGKITGQEPRIKTEYQILQANHIPAIQKMEIEDQEIDISDPLWEELISEFDFEEEETIFCFLKAEIETFLYDHGYEVPKMADGTRSEIDAPVYSMGVEKGKTDVWGMTTTPMEDAVKTVYGAAIQDVIVELKDETLTVYDLFSAIVSWYQENPQWSFGGIHAVTVEDGVCTVTVYKGEAAKASRRFFTMKEESKEVDRVYAVYENPKTLRWEYQEYTENGKFRYRMENQYTYGTGSDKRYYMDVVLTPAMAVNDDGILQPLEHTYMEYMEAGEEIIDYISGDPNHGYRVPKTRIVDKIEITTEIEMTEQDVWLENAVYDQKTGTYTIKVQTEGVDSFGQKFSDESEPLSLSFVAKLPVKTVELTDSDIQKLGNANIHHYEAGEEIGYAEYLILFQGASVYAKTGCGENLADTFIISKPLVYRGQHKIEEDGDTGLSPVQVLQRPVKQKIKVKKVIEQEQAISNFRFKLYLKSNLERLYCDENGNVIWLDTFGNGVDVLQYKDVFPELVQNYYTEKTKIPVLEMIKREVRTEDGKTKTEQRYNYEKFFDAIWTANIDQWDNEQSVIKNTSWKPWAINRFTKVENQINTSKEARENAKRSDAVRQFAVNWYLENQIQELVKQLPEKGRYQSESGAVKYPEEIYDRALYLSILEAEQYLKVFFNYDLDYILGINWDSERGGGKDSDMSTLATDQTEETDNGGGYAYGISPYLPYGEYVLTEQQPYRKEWNDFRNRHYEIDAPKEISLPVYYNEQEELVSPSLIPWSVTEPRDQKEWSGYAEPMMVNRRYGVKLRVDKLDKETGEPILHAGALFALYRAERNEAGEGDGSVKRYEKRTLISGTKPFLLAMGAEEITGFARNVQAQSIHSGELGVGMLYSGWVPAGTPICKEDDVVFLQDKVSHPQGYYSAISTQKEHEDIEAVQTVGYFETTEIVDAGVYVLAELAAPEGYVREAPMVVEIYSDAVVYESLEDDGNIGRKTAIRYGDWIFEGGIMKDSRTETARIFVNNTATSLVVSKGKSLDTVNSMKISGRVEGSVSALEMMFGLENLELAYNENGTYQGFGWKKGTLEYLEARKKAGERVELVYENDIFQGYGYVSRRLETADDENRYVPGATMALFEAIAVERTGNTEDHSFEGLKIVRDRNGNVISMTVREEESGTVTPVLFYDLGNLKVLETSRAGEVFGYDRNGQKAKLMFDTSSIFAIRNGRPEFEITGGDLYEVVYNSREKAFTNLDEKTTIYHLDEAGCRDAKVDGYTGLAYVDGALSEYEEDQKRSVYVWPVYELKNKEGDVIKREKILTGRPGEKNEGTEDAYITGTVNSKSGNLTKQINPVYDRYGLVQYYPANEETYKKGEDLYDRDGEYMGYRYDDLLELYNQAAFGVLNPTALYHVENQESVNEDFSLKHRNGEAWIIPNIWVTGEKTVQDPIEETMTGGQRDLLRRVIPGTYILEELHAPDGYVRTLPIGVSVKETVKEQNVSVADERIKIEIAKIEGTDSYKKKVEHIGDSDENIWSYEGKGAYTHQMIPGVKLALYPAKRVYTSDYQTYPNGYYLVKNGEVPVSWYQNESMEQEPAEKKAVWISSNVPEYFEGIPAGDYILEEFNTPEGYVPASMEITVQAISDLQSFVFKNDHTKLEVFKYETGKQNSKHPLQWPSLAEFSLYPALLDENGTVLMEEGEYLHEIEPVVSWKTGGQLEYAESMTKEYETMFSVYRDGFNIFSWNGKKEGIEQRMSAKCIQSHTTANGETVTQIWELDDLSKLRVTVISCDGKAREIGKGQREPVFEYQFNYKEGGDGFADGMISYDFSNGIHRIDRIPAGTYVLKETKVPNGYEGTKPILIQVETTENVQRYNVENKKEKQEWEGTLIIEKTDQDNPGKSLAGAWFEVKNLQNGEIFRAVTDENGIITIRNLPISGVYESGISGPVIYEIREILAPAGYQLDGTVRQVRFLEHLEENQEKRIRVTNEKTRIQISKQDFYAEDFVKGAKLAIYEARLVNGIFQKAGNPIDSWISEDEIHTVIGKLSGGKTYLLIEEEAPAGYKLAEPIRFTLSDDGKKIIEVSEQMMQISVAYNTEYSKIESISITGRAAIERAISSEVEGDLQISREELFFADGSRFSMKKTVCFSDSECRSLIDDPEVYPMGTTYVVRNAQEVVLEQWTITQGIQTYVLENESNQEGVLRFTKDQQYVLDEYVLLSDGTSILTGRMTFCFDEMGNLARLDFSNKKTRILVTKTDMTTGRKLSGAHLVIKDQNGRIIDQWISKNKDHSLQGILEPGEMYTLEEISAAKGYAYAKNITFRIEDSDNLVHVLMEDRPTCVEIRKTDVETGNNLPGAELILKDAEGRIIDQWISTTSAHVIRRMLIAGEAYTLIEETAPKGYDIAEPVKFTVSMDGKTDRITITNSRKIEETIDNGSEESGPVERKPKPEEVKQYGRIFAVYEATLGNRGEVKLRAPKSVTISTLPATGDGAKTFRYITGAVLALAGVLLLKKKRREDE